MIVLNHPKIRRLFISPIFDVISMSVWTWSMSVSSLLYLRVICVVFLIIHILNIWSSVRKIRTACRNVKEAMVLEVMES